MEERTTVRLYEDSGGGLFIAIDGSPIACNVTAAAEADGFEYDAVALLDGNLGDWTSIPARDLSHMLAVAEYDDATGEVRTLKGHTGQYPAGPAARRYIGPLEYSTNAPWHLHPGLQRQHAALTGETEGEGAMADAPAASWTAADVERLSAQGWRVELWKGQLLRMAPTGDVQGRMTWRIGRALDRYVEAHGLGQLWPAEAGFDLTRPDETRQTVLAPDIAFVRAERVPPPVEGYAHVVPDLVVETASPGQSRQEMDGKAQQWLERGVPLVWVVRPARHQVDEWRQGDAAPRTLGTDDTLDGHEVVPGFHMPVADLFAEL